MDKEYIIFAGLMGQESPHFITAVRRINEYIQNGISFNQETTLTGKC